MAMLAAHLACVLLGNASGSSRALALVALLSPTSAMADVFGDWKFGKIDGVCAAASTSVRKGSSSNFNILVTNDDKILFYIVLDGKPPEGPRHFGVKIAKSIHWGVGVVENGALLFDLSTKPNSSQILTEIIEGRSLYLIGGLGEVANEYSLRGSGKALLRLSKCANDNS